MSYWVDTFAACSFPMTVKQYNKGHRYWYLYPKEACWEFIINYTPLHTSQAPFSPDPSFRIVGQLITGFMT